eukprot:COSAG01_NODE_68371_length_264_cov_0.642424_1_plen_39_part_10
MAGRRQCPDPSGAHATELSIGTYRTIDNSVGTTVLESFQ